MPETNRIEYKQILTDALGKEVVAFLNYREGGFIYIGIDKHGYVVGVQDVDSDQLKIKDRLKHNISPSCLGLFDVIVEQREGKNIIKIIVASGLEKPYSLKKYGMTEKGCFIRIGSASEPMPQKMIDELFARRVRNSISKIRSNRQDLTFEQLKIYYEATGSKLNVRFAKNLELLNEDGFFNYAAYLLADNNGTSIKVAKYNGINRVNLIENNEYGYCSLVKATKQVLDKLELENKTLTHITPKERENQRLWDPIALREAIINAIVHNDYTNEVPPKFEIFNDRIEIISAGGLPEGLSHDEFYEGVSVPRNKELMRVFKDLDMVEQLGSGVPRILESYSRDCFNFSQNFLKMAFPKESDETEGGTMGGTMGGTIGGTIGGPMGGPIGGPMGGPIDDLTDRQKEVLSLIENDAKLTIRKLAKLLNINVSAAQEHIALLKDKGIIIRIGGTRGYWRISLEEKDLPKKI